VPLKDYEQICRVGEGTFGLVYKARHRKSGELVALKKVILHYEQQDGVSAPGLQHAVDSTLAFALRLLRAVSVDLPSGASCSKNAPPSQYCPDL
jgi:serine/threonine protein kinase